MLKKPASYVLASRNPQRSQSEGARLGAWGGRVKKVYASGFPSAAALLANYPAEWKY